MFKSFLVDTTNFVPFGSEHYLILLGILIFGVYFIYSGKYRWEKKQKRNYAIILAGAMAFTQLFKMFVRMYLGNYDQTTDLPFHLCSSMPFVLMYIYYTEKRNVWAIFFFWMMAGTSQALFTGTIKDVLPHYESIRYWLVHGGCVILSIYGFVVYGWRLKFTDVLKSCLAMNVAALFVYPINIWLGSNYFFLNGKPDGKTLYNLLPEWPTYILCLEGVLLLLFSVVYFVFKGIEHFVDKPKS